MADDADNADQRIGEVVYDAIGRAHRCVLDIPPGEPGMCDFCGHEFSRLVKGVCGFCRDKYKV